MRQRVRLKETYSDSHTELASARSIKCGTYQCPHPSSATLVHVLQYVLWKRFKKWRIYVVEIIG